jgi:hypothetical protein
MIGMSVKRVALAFLVAGSIALADAPRVNWQALSRLEGQIDGLFTKGPNPCDIIGNTRGMYLDNYGAVFTTLIAVVPTPTPNPFRDFTAKDIMDVHQRKIRQLPILREKMRETMLVMVASPALEGVRPEEQIVCGVSLFYYKWENVTGLPAQIIMQAEKRKLLDVQAGRLPMSQLDSIIKVQEL